jgi:hypothetical protein
MAGFGQSRVGAQAAHDFGLVDPAGPSLVAVRQDGDLM